MKFCRKTIILCAVLAVLSGVPLLTAQDSTAAASDSSAASVADSSTTADTSAAVAVADSSTTADTSAAVAADSTAPVPPGAAAAADTAAKPKKKPRPPGDRVAALIIPWDWDEYTNVIEVGLRRDDGREYSLTKNEFYQQLFDNLGLKVLAIGKVTRDPDGFYNMTVEYIEPADSTRKLAAGQRRRRP